jgi:hypothetical protein
MLRRITQLIALCFITVSASAESSLDMDKLVGKWCFTHVEIGGEIDTENIPYEFLENGEFTFKNSSTASSNRKSKYTLNGNKLNIGGLAPGGLKIVELTDVNMVAEGSFSSKRHFKRGNCD